MPFRFLRRLDIHMVIDGHRRMVRARRPATRHNGIAAGLDDLCFGARIGQYLLRDGRHAPHVVRFRRIHANRWNFDHLAEEIFKSCATMFDVRFELLIHRHV